MRRTSPGDAPTHVAASPAALSWLCPRSTSCDSPFLCSSSLPAPPLRTCCRCFSSHRPRTGRHGYHPSASTIQAHHPRELRLTVLRMGDQKPFMMMAPMFLPHCPGDEDQPLPDIPAPCPYLTSQHPDRQLNGPPPHCPGWIQTIGFWTGSTLHPPPPHGRITNAWGNVAVRQEMLA